MSLFRHTTKTEAIEEIANALSFELGTSIHPAAIKSLAQSIDSIAAPAGFPHSEILLWIHRDAKDWTLEEFREACRGYAELQRARREAETRLPPGWPA